MHVPVLLEEVIKYLDPQPDENFIDATFGEGGHAAAILKENAPRGEVLGLEADPELCKKFEAGGTGSKKNGGRLILVNSSYTKIGEVVKNRRFGPVAGILFDLGLSSWHLEESGRGFSFLRDEPLDMRYDPDSGNLTAEDIVNKYTEEDLAQILRTYGEERFARRIAKKITEERKRQPVRNTFELVEIVKKSTPGWCHHRRLHFATRTFQALRIAVNDELGNLRDALRQAPEILVSGGRLAAISFHSLEDRIVKHFLREEAKKGNFRVLTKKPVAPDAGEIKLNPRARSAKLRAAIKI